MRTIFLGDFGNRMDIQDAEDDIRRTQRQIRTNRGILTAKTAEVKRLSKKLKQQAEMIELLTGLLVDKGVINQAEVDEMNAKFKIEEALPHPGLKFDFPKR